MAKKTNQTKETMQLTKKDKKLLIRALNNLEQTIYNLSDNYLNTADKFISQKESEKKKFISSNQSFNEFQNMVAKK